MLTKKSHKTQMEKVSVEAYCIKNTYPQWTGAGSDSRSCQERVRSAEKGEEPNMALAMMEVGETRQIQAFHGKEEVKRHLQDLGFVKGGTVQVVGENASGMILLVKGVRIALNRGLASQIMVA